MDSILPRQRVLTALSHKSTDRIPLDFWATPEVWKNLKEHYKTNNEETVLKELKIDIRQFQPDYTGTIIKYEDGSYLDPMGTHRKSKKNEFCEYEEYASWPLLYANTVEELEDFPYWPDIDKYDFKNFSDKIGDSYKTYYIKMETGGLYEMAWALRGFEQFMTDLILQPEIAGYIMKRLTDFYCEYVRRAMKYAGSKIDMVYTYDDIASQRSLLLSKEIWKETIEPYHKQLNKVIKEYNKTIMYHSCGSIYELIPLLMDLPIDVLNPLQPLAEGMDLKLIKENYGLKLCFHGGIDIQYLLPKGTKEEIKQKVIETIDILGKNGGYILSSAHYIQADTPVENILTMYETACSYKI